MHGARWWLVCYDVRDPKRLRKTAKHMEGYGERMQYSVFRCWMTMRQVQCLRWELTELLTADDDVLLIPAHPLVPALRGGHPQHAHSRQGSRLARDAAWPRHCVSAIRFTHPRLLCGSGAMIGSNARPERALTFFDN